MSLTTLLERTSDLRFFERITIGRFTISVQASDMHACSPRETGLPVDRYTHFEVQISKGDGYITPENCAQLGRFAEYWSDDLSVSSIARYVPLVHVEELLTLLGVLDETNRRFGS